MPLTEQLKGPIALITPDNGQYRLEPLRRGLQRLEIPSVFGNARVLTRKMEALEAFIADHHPAGAVWELTPEYAASLEYARLARDRYERQFPFVFAVDNLTDIRNALGQGVEAIQLFNNPNVVEEVVRSLGIMRHDPSAIPIRLGSTA